MSAEAVLTEKSHFQPTPRRVLSPGEWLLLSILASVQFTHIVDFMVMMPLGPSLIKEMKLTPSQFAYLVSAYSISAGIAGLAAAKFIDRFDRKFALLSLYAGFAAGTWLCAIVNTYSLLLIARAVAGAFGGVAAAVVLATVGDAFADARRGTAMGVVMSAFSVASIVGVPLGIKLSAASDWHAPFFWLGVASILVLILASYVLPPLRGHMTRGDRNGVAVWALARDPNHLRSFAFTAAICFGSFTVFPFLATYLVANVGLRKDQLGYMYIYGGLITLVTLAIIGRASDRFGKLVMFRWMAGATIISILLVTNLPPGLSLGWVLLATTFMFIVTSGRMVPANAMITASAIPEERGGFMSLNAAVQHVACGIAAVISGSMLNQKLNFEQTHAVALVGYPWVGLLASAATLASLFLAGRLRPAVGGELAPDEPVIAAEMT